MPLDNLLHIGRLTGRRPSHGDVQVRLRGIRGDMFHGSFLFLDIDGLKVPFGIEEMTVRDDCIFVAFREKDVDYAMIADTDVYASAEDIDEPDDDMLRDDPSLLTGFSVIDAEAGRLGRIVSVDDRTANCLLTVRGSRELLVPLAENLVDHLDVARRELHVRLPQGLIQINDDTKTEI